MYRDTFVSTRTVPAGRSRRTGRRARGDRSAATPATAMTTAVAAPVVVALGGPTARQVSAMAVPLARARGAEVHVLHVVERDILLGEDAAEIIAAGVTARIASHAPAHVIVVTPRAGALGRPLSGVAGRANPAAIWDGSNPSR